jgi:hypothetical protein
MPKSVRGVANKKLVRLPRDTGGCWEWEGRLDTNNMPVKTRNHGACKACGEVARREILNARRWVWETFYGAVPEGKVVLSKCGNLKCVNLGHLELGTRYDSAIARRSSKISKEDAAEIRAQYDRGVPVATIAAQYDINDSLVSRIGLRQMHRKKNEPQIHEGRRRGRREAVVPVRCDAED